jgi:tetratricopeptide (TPR) repeat protein
MRVVLAVFLCLAFFCQASAADEVDVNKKIAECNQFIKNEMPEKALDFSSQLLKKNAKNRDVVLCKTRAQLALNLFSEAVSTLTMADLLSNSPNEHMMSLAMLGNAYKGAQQFAEAITSYQKSLAIAKSQMNKNFERIAYGLIGEAQTLNNQYDDAILSYQSALKLGLNDNERADSFEHIASIYNLQKKHNQAIEYQVKATLAYTHYGDIDAQANAGLDFGLYYMNAGEYGPAEKAINKILKLAVDNGGAYWEAKSSLYLANLKIANNQIAEAKTLLERAQKLNLEVVDAILAESISTVLNKLSK